MNEIRRPKLLAAGDRGDVPGGTVPRHWPACCPDGGARIRARGDSVRRSRATKEPHWTGSTASPNTFGHFGGSGTFLWVDPDLDLACITLTDREFGDWAVAAWPPFSDAVRAAYG